MAEERAQLIEPGAGETLDVVGATVELIAFPDAGTSAPCVIRGTIPPGGIVPLHSHADFETFITLSGAVEGLAYSNHGHRWVRIGRGDILHVPGDAKHAWRNVSDRPATSIITTTERMGRFFREIGTRLEPGQEPASPPSDVAVQTLLETAERYGHWNATPEENAEVGLVLPAPGG